jgi:hypothetical protein
MELPLPELELDVGLLSSGGSEPRGQSVGSKAHLLRPRQALFGQPPAVAGLERIGKPAEVAKGERWDPGADGEASRPVRPGQLEGAQSLQSSPER